MDLTVIYTFDHRDDLSTNLLRASILSGLRELPTHLQTVVYTHTSQELTSLLGDLPVLIEPIPSCFHNVATEAVRYEMVRHALMQYRTPVIYLDPDTLWTYNQGAATHRWLASPVWFSVYAVDRTRVMTSLLEPYPQLLQTKHPWGLHPVDPGMLYFRHQPSSREALDKIIALREELRRLAPACHFVDRLALAQVWYASHCTHALYPPVECSHLGQDFSTLQVEKPPKQCPPPVVLGRTMGVTTSQEAVEKMERDHLAEMEGQPYQGHALTGPQLPILIHYHEEKHRYPDLVTRWITDAIVHHTMEGTFGIDWHPQMHEDVFLLFPYGLSLPGTRYRDFEEPDHLPHNIIIFWTFTPNVTNEKGNNLIMLEASIATGMYHLGDTASFLVYSTKPHLLAYLEERYPGLRVVQYVPAKDPKFTGGKLHFSDIGHARLSLLAHLLRKFERTVFYLDNDTLFRPGCRNRLLEMFADTVIYGCCHEFWITFRRDHHYAPALQNRNVAGWQLNLDVNPVNNGLIIIPNSPAGHLAVQRMLAIYEALVQVNPTNYYNDMLAFSICWYSLAGSKVFDCDFHSDGKYQPTHPLAHIAEVEGRRGLPPASDGGMAMAPFPQKMCPCTDKPCSWPPVLHYYRGKWNTPHLISHLCAVLVATYLRTGHVCLNHQYVQGCGVEQPVKDCLSTQACDHLTIIPTSLDPLTPREFWGDF